MLSKLSIVVIVFYYFQNNTQVHFMCMAFEKFDTVLTDAAQINLNHYKKYLMRPLTAAEKSYYLRSVFQKNSEVDDEQLIEVIKNMPQQYHKPTEIQFEIKPVKVRPKTLKHKKKSDAEAMIRADGYEAETHTVHTSDGYILTIHRVLPGKKHENKGNSKFRETHRILLHHGLLGSSEDWLFAGPGHALPYLLTDEGYDVWLLNARGNKYAREHISNFVDSNKFWNFSWHQMGMYDLPAVMKYIKKSASKAKTYFVGHSMGATALLVLLSTKPRYNRQLRSAILLAPLAFMYHVQGPLRRLTEFHNRANISSLIDKNEFSADGLYFQVLNKSYCIGHMSAICSNELLLIADGGKEIYDMELQKTILSHVPAGTSTRTIIHYMQLVKSGFFRKFDYGKVINYKRYYLEEPPSYKLENVVLPISVISSTSDWLATESDVTTLVTTLENVKVHHIIKSSHEFGHLDFVWSRKAQELVFGPVMTILRRDIK